MNDRRHVHATLALALACATACGPAIVAPDQGVAVGNPGNLRMDLAPVAGATFQSTRMTARELSLISCGGDIISVTTDLDLELGPERPIAFPGDAWCGVLLDDVRLQTELVIDEAVLEPPPISWESIELTGMEGSQASDDLALWFGAPLWADLEDLGPWLRGEERDDEGFTTTEIAEVLEEESTLMVDTLSDGPDASDPVVASVELEERDEEEEEEEEEEEARSADGAGCGSDTEGRGAFGLLIFGLLGLRRRPRV